jgi:hypothetical protein
VLGVARSGTTWIAQTLSRCRPPLTYLEEPFFRLLPPLVLADSEDHTAVGISPESREDHETLCCILRYLSNEPKAARRMLLDAPFKIQKQAPAGECVLIKEVHALLGTESCVRTLQCPTILVVRNPIVTTDSIMDYCGMGFPYLYREYEEVWREEFMTRYVGDRIEAVSSLRKTIERTEDERLRAVLKKGLTVYLLQIMLEKVAGRHENAQLVSYDHLLRNPDEGFRELAAFFRLQYADGACDFSDDDPTHSNPDNDLSRNRNSLLDRPFKFLRPAERSRLEEMYCELGWDGGGKPE